MFASFKLASVNVLAMFMLCCMMFAIVSSSPTILGNNVNELKFENKIGKSYLYTCPYKHSPKNIVADNLTILNNQN